MSAATASIVCGLMFNVGVFTSSLMALVLPVVNIRAPYRSISVGLFTACGPLKCGSPKQVNGINGSITASAVFGILTVIAYFFAIMFCAIGLRGSKQAPAVPAVLLCILSVLFGMVQMSCELVQVNILQYVYYPWMGYQISYGSSFVLTTVTFVAGMITAAFYVVGSNSSKDTSVNRL